MLPYTRFQMYSWCSVFPALAPITCSLSLLKQADCQPHRSTVFWKSRECRSRPEGAEEGSPPPPSRRREWRAGQEAAWRECGGERVCGECEGSVGVWGIIFRPSLLLTYFL